MGEQIYPENGQFCWFMVTVSLAQKKTIASYSDDRLTGFVVASCPMLPTSDVQLDRDHLFLSLCLRGIPFALHDNDCNDDWIQKVPTFPKNRAHVQDSGQRLSS